MKTVVVLFLHLIVTMARLLGPGGARALIAETMAIKHQLLIANRSRKRAPNLTTGDRFLLGLLTLFINPRRIGKVAVIVSRGTVLRFHEALKKRKYSRLFSAKGRGKPGPE